MMACYTFRVFEACLIAYLFGLAYLFIYRKVDNRSLVNPPDPAEVNWEGMVND